MTRRTDGQQPVKESSGEAHLLASEREKVTWTERARSRLPWNPTRFDRSVLGIFPQARAPRLRQPKQGSEGRAQRPGWMQRHTLVAKDRWRPGRGWVRPVPGKSRTCSSRGLCGSGRGGGVADPMRKNQAMTGGGGGRSDSRRPGSSDEQSKEGRI
jgi:hypothetical protein